MTGSPAGVEPGSPPGSGGGPAGRVGRVVEVVREAYLLRAPHRRLVLVRHGETARQPGDRPYDPPLSERGGAQAERVAARLARWLAHEDVVVASSPRRRAVETARPIAGALGVGVVEVAGLAEVGGFDAPVPVPVDGPGLVPGFCWEVPGGPFRPTAVAGVEEALARAGASTVVAVAHGGVVNAYVSHLLGLRCEFFFHPEHTSLTVVRLGEGRVVLERLNDHAHLEGLTPAG